jgi:hypothetical protein
MKSLSILLFAISLTVFAQTTTPSGPMNNQRVMALVQAGLSAADVARIISSAPTVDFNLSPPFTDQLLKYGVSEDTIKLMSARLKGVNAPVIASAAAVVPPLKATEAVPAPRAAAPIAAIEDGIAGSVPLLGQRQPHLYISPMQGNLDGFIAAEIIKQHVPIVVVIDERDAQFVLTGLSLQEDDKWYHIAFGTFKDRNEGNVRLLNVQTKTMVWAGEAGDRSLIYGAFKRGGQRKIAQRITEHLKKEYFSSAN